jgi:hypothetical protein
MYYTGKTKTAPELTHQTEAYKLFNHVAATSKKTHSPFERHIFSLVAPINNTPKLSLDSVDKDDEQ